MLKWIYINKHHPNPFICKLVQWIHTYVNMKQISWVKVHQSWTPCKVMQWIGFAPGSKCFVCPYFTLLSWCRLWRTDPALCQWNRATAARPPSTPQTTPSSPPPPPWKRWMNAGTASSRKDSTSASSYILHSVDLRVLICKSLPSLLFPCLRCSHILLELMETERDYVRDLGLVVEVSWCFINSGSAYLLYTHYCTFTVL